MEITVRFIPKNRSDWRKWLMQYHDTKNEIWLFLTRDKSKENISYLDAVEEALCFGWIDGITKVATQEYQAIRFSPRRPKSNWTELNKERCRRLIKLNLMTPAGLKVLPDLYEEFVIPPQILTELKKDKLVWKNFQSFPLLYQKIRINSLTDMLRTKQSDVYDRRLKTLIEKTREGKMFGEWNDGGRLS